MKRIKTNLILSCIVLTTGRNQVGKFTEFSEEGFYQEWGSFPTNRLFRIQNLSLRSPIFFMEGEPLKGIQVQNAFVIKTGKLFGKKTCSLVLHLKASREVYVKIKHKFIVPCLVYEHDNPEPYMCRFRVLKKSPEQMATSPTILGEQLVREIK